MSIGAACLFAALIGAATDNDEVAPVNVQGLKIAGAPD
jgi:hypothetical protein